MRRGRAVAAAMVAAAMVIGMVVAIPAHGQTALTCSTSFEGYEICQDAQGHRTTTWERQGETFGQDSDGDQWSTTDQQGRSTTTIKERR